MISEYVRSAISKNAMGSLVTINKHDGDLILEVQINGLSWYETKCIFWGVVKEATNSDYIGQSYTGVISHWVRQYSALLEGYGLNLNDSQLAYLLTEWDDENPTTAHEMTAKFLRERNRVDTLDG